MINLRERLIQFLSDGEARNRYRKAILELQDLHIFDILREIQSDMPLSIQPDDKGSQLDLMNYHRMYGYMQALNDIEYLVESRKEPTSMSSPDFGAYSSLLKEGFTEEEINKMLSGD